MQDLKLISEYLEEILYIELNSISTKNKSGLPQLNITYFEKDKKAPWAGIEYRHEVLKKSIKESIKFDLGMKGKFERIRIANQRIVNAPVGGEEALTQVTYQNNRKLFHSREAAEGYLKTKFDGVLPNSRIDGEVTTYYIDSEFAARVEVFRWPSQLYRKCGLDLKNI